MYKLLALISIVITYAICLFMLPRWISRAKNHGLVGKDIHKRNSQKVAEAGGIIVLLSAAIGLLIYIAILVFYYNNQMPVIAILAALCSLFLALIIGFVDDILGWRIGLRQRDKVLLSLLIPLPIMVVNAGHHTMHLPFFGSVNFGILYPLIIIPIAIIGAANAFNMLAGYNGLETGMGILILLSLGLMLWIKGDGSTAIIALCLVASLIAFLGYNLYPAQVFPGDTMTYPVGAAIAMVAILGNIERFAVYLFPLYFIELALKAKGRFVPDWTSKLQKGSLSNKGHWNTLPHVVISLLRKLNIKSTEPNVVHAILLFQLMISTVTFLVYI